MLQAALDTAPRLFQLAIPAFLGAIAGRAGLFRDPEEAITTLNTYALNIGFPALIALGLVDARLALPSSPLFYLAWPICLAVMLLTLRIIPAWRESLGTLSLVVVFGNVAYLGLPYVRATFGEQIGGAAALAVAIHVTGAVTQHGGGEGGRSPLPSRRGAALATGVCKSPCCIGGPAFGHEATSI